MWIAAHICGSVDVSGYAEKGPERGNRTLRLKGASK